MVLNAGAEWESGNGDRVDDFVEKLAEDAKGFHMDGAVGDGRLPRNLADNIGHLIERYRIGAIKQRSAKLRGVGE